MLHHPEPPPRYLVSLTCVRTLRSHHQHRDERADPELILESFAAADLAAATQVFNALCGLPMVKAGRQRAKIVQLASSDTLRTTQWDAPLLTSAARPA
ncbi:hypothetical protein ACFQY4_21240 [Catellatospora bangladeshensis]|uniref:Uncharacterized protein n=1 Tax=Catellatospora bangladeshensis TaxID=310355 RepID=A0A8J3JKZ6_9ACTN|nr:hypothetical protein [Catellatospora bangladeshensis]GIF84404.1 hypothetical protein Cba03nite_57530 [Catellatospora bangladeshensis]